jgi:hypothetical protein
MSEGEGADPLARELAIGAVGATPVIGPLLEPLAKKTIAAWAEQQRLKASKALSAAERVTGLSRDELEDRISQEPRLLSLTARLLFSAGMNDYEPIIESMGRIVGEAIADVEKRDQADLVLNAIAGLGRLHVAVLRAAKGTPPRPDDAAADANIAWQAETLATAAGLERDMTLLCSVGLANAGLLRTLSLMGGLGYEVTELGDVVLDVIREQRQGGAQDDWR